MQPTTQTPLHSSLRTGRVISGVMVLFLVFDSVTQLMKVDLR